MRRGLTGKQQPSLEEEGTCACGRYFGLSDGRLCPTLVFAGGCVAAIAGLALTVVGAVGGAQTGFASNVAYLVLLVVGLVLVGLGTATLIVSFLWISCKKSTRVQVAAGRGGETPDGRRTARAEGARGPRALASVVSTTDEKVSAWLRTALPSPPTPEPSLRAESPASPRGTTPATTATAADALPAAARRTLPVAQQESLRTAAAHPVRKISAPPTAPIRTTATEFTKGPLPLPEAPAERATAANAEVRDETNSVQSPQRSSPVLSNN